MEIAPVVAVGNGPARVVAGYPQRRPDHGPHEPVPAQGASDSVGVEVETARVVPLIPSGTGDVMSEGSTVWEVRLGIYATEQQAEEVKELTARMLCPDPDHAPPCPIPWSISLLHVSDLEDDYPELVEKARAESQDSRP
ncbi:hypothetical protein GCM10012275_03780 [Longimycelium tulufanense]|uniref:SPOR domain-containing protein n=1 Tax=Longimycelium tulufanense TaxID=907463 RepID=A0A8J3CA61_9PSEU|nr:hypothetical protein [Longimycelium tulufanense]GGM35799.1 hypothetical protein GCM10012275_03780 [Longimycelium tulufanense]